MRSDNSVNLGTIQVHKRVIADICSLAIADIDGVTMAKNGALDNVCSFFGARNNSAVDVMVDANSQVSVVVKVNIRFGLNLSDISRRVQDVVMTAVERMADINLKDVDVSIQGIERGQA